ncbi:MULTISPECIES: RNA polymerase sigma factor [unclassified Arsukibacterium]|uniref:RNA polymerase sigma factor n=1 Tax=unclassified Arsukibacterium TaxID=2635278 RepID=UPI0025C4D24B|nr:MULTISPECIES: RNA polymerase sigma factor [unclassified Arsukibacterium]|tara:strand:- start:4891 stop:5421 length:531 start_codon:yes stop_codon:yes gene_type:complete
MQQAQLDLLVLAMQDGDKRAFGLLYQHYHRDLRRFAAYLLANPTVAEDLVQNVWLKVSRRIARLNDPAVFTSWLYRAVRWEVLDYQKQAVNCKQQTIDSEALAAQVSPANSLHHTDDIGDLSKALALLAAEERLVLQLHYLHELELSQIALIVDIPLGTVKSRLHRARQQLYQQLQ